MPNKIVIVDASIISSRAIFQWGNMIKLQSDGKIPKDQWIAPADYTYFNIILSLFKKIGINKEDLVIFALDASNSWRKFFLSTYKGNRDGFRKTFEHINFPEQWAKVDEINHTLNKYTNWQFIKIGKIFHTGFLNITDEARRFNIYNTVHAQYGLEADDIIAGIVSHYKDKEIIIVSSDADLKQLCDNTRVKFFAIHLKLNGQKGCYCPVENNLKILADKIRKGDKGDNILISANDTDKDIDIRRLIIDLNNLPKWVQDPIDQSLNNLKDKETDIRNLPFQNSLAKRFSDIYKTDKIVTFEQSEHILDVRKTRQLKKAKLKRQQAKEESFR